MNLTWNFRHFFIGSKLVYGTQNKQSPLFILYFSTYFDHNKLSRVLTLDTTMARVEIYLVLFQVWMAECRARRKTCTGFDGLLWSAQIFSSLVPSLFSQFAIIYKSRRLKFQIQRIRNRAPVRTHNLPLDANLFDSFASLVAESVS